MSCSSKPSCVGVRANALTVSPREPPELWDPDLDHEAAARPEVGGHVLEAGDLLVLGRQVPDGVEDQVGDREPALDGGGGEVADGHADPLGPWLGPQPRHHGLRQVDAVHADAASGQGQGDPAGADAELQGGPLSGQAGQELDHGIHDRGLEHVGGRPVVAGRHLLAEVVLGHGGMLSGATGRRHRVWPEH
jgi:hypothetical protein